MDQELKNDSKTNSPIPEIAAGCSMAGLVVVAAVWLILETFYFLNYFSDPEAGGHNLRELYHGHLAVTALCAVIGVPLLLIWGLCVKPIKRRDRNTMNSHPGALDTQFRAPQESWGQRQEVPKAGSPFLGIAGALSCGGAVLVGLFWLGLMLLCHIPLRNNPGQGMPDSVLAGIGIITMFCAFIEIPLLTVWGVCADRKHKKAQNRNDSKSDSWFLNLAKALSFGCLAVIAFIFLEDLPLRLGFISHSTLKIIEWNTAPFMLLITYCAFIAVPVLFIRNIYAHIKWRKDQNGR